MCMCVYVCVRVLARHPGCKLQPECECDSGSGSGSNSGTLHAQVKPAGAWQGPGCGDEGVCECVRARHPGCKSFLVHPPPPGVLQLLQVLRHGAQACAGHVGYAQPQAPPGSVQHLVVRLGVRLGRACVCACLRVCVRAFVRVHVCACGTCTCAVCTCNVSACSITSSCSATQ